MRIPPLVQPVLSAEPVVYWPIATFVGLVLESTAILRLLRNLSSPPPTTHVAPMKKGSEPFQGNIAARIAGSPGLPRFSSTKMFVFTSQKTPSQRRDRSPPVIATCWPE